MTPKLYIAFSYSLSCIPREHRSLNGGCQVSVAARVLTKKRFAELLCLAQYKRVDARDVSSVLRHLNTYCLVQVAHESMAVYPAVATVVKDDTLYYSPDGHCKTGFIRDWFEVPLRQ